MRDRERRIGTIRDRKRRRGRQRQIDRVRETARKMKRQTVAEEGEVNVGQYVRRWEASELLDG